MDLLFEIYYDSIFIFYYMYSGISIRRLVDKPLWGLRVDGPMGRRFLRGLSLTAAMPLRVVVGASKFIEGALL